MKKTFDESELAEGFHEAAYPDEEEEQFPPEDDWDPERQDTIQARWVMDGTENLTEAARRLRDFADLLIRLEADGWQLVEPIKNDCGFIERF